MTRMLMFLLVVTAFCLGGCKSQQDPGIVLVSSDTYLLTRQSAPAPWGNPGALKGLVIQEANAFAEQKGKVAVPVSSKERLMPNTRWLFEYQFRLANKDDPQTRGGALPTGPDVVIERRSNLKADIQTTDSTKNAPDLYTELMKLDELRKRGLITDAEYETEKSRLLRRNGG